jgi:hypothetical protein
MPLELDYNSRYLLQDLVMLELTKQQRRVSECLEAHGRSDPDRGDPLFWPGWVNVVMLTKALTGSGLLSHDRAMIEELEGAEKLVASDAEFADAAHGDWSEMASAS